ncbi:paraquat-inducible protein B [Aliarcobacter faecis]|uniref:MlaD family protein n=1 Tax=Aliarcobacter faecis TaxID=1564138 RepID=UPI00047A074C|nr:MlaD family protein [Aliarcobacter faecis]QKF72904.1 paraquat-inducible protein B [Aliarcobacter faecis]
MSKEIVNNENLNETVVYQAKQESKKKFSFVWLLPLVILGILGYIAYESYSKKGTNIIVYFKSAEGLKENVTPLEYKGLTLGKVTKISMNEDLKSVAVNILVNSDVANYVANENSKFWIKKPTVSLTKVSGLNTLISGYKIELSTSLKNQEDLKNIKYKWYFDGLDSQPDEEFEENGYYVTLLANDKDNIDVGTPIFYNKYQIGEIISKEFKSEEVYASAYIYDKYNYLVNKSSKFIMNEALKVSYGASGLNIEVGSLYSAIIGGITVVTTAKDDDKISKDDIQILYASKDDLKKKIYFSLDFNDAKIEEKTPILFKGIEIGRVTNIKLNEDILSAKAYVYEEYKYLLTKNSRFFVEEPTISFGGIKNLGNIIKGNYISLDYKEGEFSDKFSGVSKKDLKKSLDTIKIDLVADSLNSINDRSKIYYKNIEIGRVDSYELSKDYKSVRISILIDERYKDLINDNSKFYDMSSKLVEIKNFDMNVNYSGLESVLNGAIGLVSNKNEAKLNKKEFTLFPSYKDIEKINRDKNSGFIVYTEFDNSFIIKENMALVYKNQEIGFVKNIKFDNIVSKVEFFVYEDFRQYIKNTSRFFKKPKIDFKASLSGVIFEVDNFSSFLEGSIELDNSSKTPLGNHEIYASFDEMQMATNMVTIVFDDVEGLQEDFSKIVYKGANIGKVKKISLNKNQKVEVKAIIDRDFNEFAKEGTIYYLKKPRISLQEVANVGSTIMAVNIGVIKNDKNEKSGYQTSFIGSDKEPAVNSHFGTIIKVEDKTASSVNVDSPIYYKNVQIGKVLKVDLSEDASRVIIDCLIQDKYKKFVRKNSEFYDISGFEMEFSIFSGSKIESNTITSIIKGGLVVVTPYDYKEIATTNDRFNLNKTLRDDWKIISPSIK